MPPRPPGSHLVDAVVAVSLLGGILADAPPLGAAHHPHRLPRPPVLGLGSEFVIERRVAVEGQCPAEGRDEGRVGGGGEEEELGEVGSESDRPMRNNEL